MYLRPVVQPSPAVGQAAELSKKSQLSTTSADQAA
jgi:hypothetical protein